jgi:antitoxin (DNA-binding transcriptional repressor) of toxin-antitoxin stability system
MVMRMSVSEFKAKCTWALREVAAAYKTVEVTKHGKVIAVVAPPKPEKKRAPKHFFGSLAGTASHVGDIVAPAADAKDWDAAR